MRLQARATSKTPLFKKGEFVGLSGPGPFRWFHVVRTKRGFALGSIYRTEGDDLTPAEVAEVKAGLALAKYEVIELP